MMFNDGASLARNPDGSQVLLKSTRFGSVLLPAGIENEVANSSKETPFFLESEFKEAKSDPVTVHDREICGS
jgi:hypothetical protein